MSQCPNCGRQLSSIQLAWLERFCSRKCEHDYFSTKGTPWCIRLRSTGEILGTFPNLREANDWHDAWLDKWFDETGLSNYPACDFFQV